MRKAILPLIIASTLASGVALAEDGEESASESLEAQLEAARERLEEAAHEVAELSAELGRPVIQRITKELGPRRAVIGVQLDPASGKDGARVEEVSPGGPAAEAGIQPQDVIVMVNGTDVKGDSAREVARIMRGVKPESKVNVRVLRGGKPKDFVVVARPVVFPMFNVATPPMPPHPPEPMEPGEPLGPLGPMTFSWFGGDFADMELATLTPQLGSYFGTTEGVLVVRAPEREGLELQDGDVILAIDGRKPSSGSHVTRILRSYQPGEKVGMKIMRQRKPIDLAVMLPEHKKRAAWEWRTKEPE